MRTNARAQVAETLGHTFVPMTLGSALLLAAGFKVHQLVVEPPITNVWLLIVLVQVEAALGLFLVFRVIPKRTRYAAIALFGCFLVVSALNVMRGAQSCSCLGKFELSPWISLTFDVVALSGLCLWRPVPLERNNVQPLPIVLSCLSLLPVLVWLSSVSSFPQLVVKTTNLEVIQAAKGERRDLEIQVQNPHDESVLITHVDSTCPCLHVPNAPFVIEPGREMSLLMELDLSKEPGFTGSLTIEITGRTSANQSAFRARITVQVKGAV